MPSTAAGLSQPQCFGRADSLHARARRGGEPRQSHREARHASNTSSRVSPPRPGRVPLSAHLARCAAALLFLSATLGAIAGSFTANPVRLTVPAGATSTALLLENTGDQPVLVQAELVAWSQAGGKDVLTPSQDLVVSPPIFRIAAGASQTVRVGLLRPAAPDREMTYRLFLQEVPEPRPAGEPGVSVALRLGLPIFVLPRGPSAPQMAWRARPDREGITLTLTNSGNAHVQVLSCKLYGEDRKLVAEQQLAAYVLPGQSRSWLIKTAQPWRGEKLRLTAQTSGGDVAAEISAH